MSSLKLVKEFYNSDLANNDKVVANYFHKNCELHWTSSQGFALLKYNDIIDFFKGTRESYESIRFEFTHLFEAESKVVARYTLFGNTIEDPDTEVKIAHFTTIWEIRENKLYRGYEISQQADENNSESLKSYTERNI